MTTPADGSGSFNPFDGEALQCPFPHYARLRREAPVAHLRDLDMYLVTRHDLVAVVLRDPATFSSRFGRPTMPLSGDDAARVDAAIAEGYPRVSTMLTADPPEHTRFRALVSRAFNARAIAAMEPLVRATVTDLIDAWADRTDIELVADFAVPLPVRVIATMLGQPADRFADIKRWSDASIAGIGTNLSVEERIAAERETNEFQRHFAAEIEARRTAPSDDLVSALVHATVPTVPSVPTVPTDDTACAPRDATEDVAGAAGDAPDDGARGGDELRPLDLAEMLSIISQLMVAGNETTTKLLTEMVRLLGERPDEWAAVHADRSRVERVVEEALRLSSPTQGIFRIATRDVELGGVTVPRGARLVLGYGAANRDDSVFDDAEQFDPDRPRLKEHLAFGRGIHFCLGAALSRLEARVALEELSRRIASFRLAPTNDFRYFPSFMLRGLVRLEIELDAPASP